MTQVRTLIRAAWYAVIERLSMIVNNNVSSTFIGANKYLRYSYLCIYILEGSNMHSVLRSGLMIIVTFWRMSFKSSLIIASELCILLRRAHLSQKAHNYLETQVHTALHPKVSRTHFTFISIWINPSFNCPFTWAQQHWGWFIIRQSSPPFTPPLGRPFLYFPLSAVEEPPIRFLCWVFC